MQAGRRLFRHNEFRISDCEDYQEPQAPQYVLSHLHIDPHLLAETGTTDVFTIPICPPTTLTKTVEGEGEQLAGYSLVY